MRPWRTIRLWPDSTVFVIGGGPSLKEMDLSPIHSRRVIGVNDAFKLGDWVDVVFWGDCRWAIWNHAELEEYKGLSITCSQCHCKHPRAMQLKRRHAFGICINPDEVCWNRNSGASAINLAYHLGAKNVVLLGFDMRVQEGKHNWHDNHKVTPRVNIYDRFLQTFPKIAEDAKVIGLQIYNATPDSALTIFPKITIEEALQL